MGLMKICVIGAGYAGLVSAVGFAGRGHDVACIDKDAGKISKITKGLPPFFEAGLGERLRGVQNAGRLEAGTDYSAIQGADIVILAVGTPSLPDGSADLSHVRAACAAVADELKRSDKFAVVAVRSTVLPGTTEKVVGPAIEKSGVRFGLAMVPEFLREGSALSDFDKPDRIVVGCSDDKTKTVMEGLYGSFDCPKLFVDIRTAEMIKYASNAFLASRIALTNETANICQKAGVDADEVLKAVGMDARLGPHFLVPGSGFGGSCLPKDVSALARHAQEVGEDAPLLHAIHESNQKQKLRLFHMLGRMMHLKGKKIAILGLSFKAGTDDIRESPALSLIPKLLEEGAHVRAFDPEAMGSMRDVFPNVEYANDWEECLSGCDAALLVTAWPEFQKSAAEYKEALGAAPLLDSRRILPPNAAAEANLAYHAIGRGAP
jgi:UDPglucose 6-dehydrogenase